MGGGGESWICARNDSDRAGCSTRGRDSCEDDLWDSHGSADGDGAARAWDHLTDLVGTRDDSGGDHLDGGVSGRGSRSRSDSQHGGDGFSTSGNTGVRRNKWRTNTLEVANGLGYDLVRLSMGVQAGKDVVHIVAVGAVAGRVSVILAANGKHPGVQARWDNTRARQRLNRVGRRARGLRSRRGGR